MNQPGHLVRALDWAREKSVMFSYDRSGFERRNRDFDPAELEVDMTGKVCLVTGANSGIGKATARGLARRGAEVVLLCRDADRCRVTRDEIRKESGNPQVHAEVVDLSRKDSVREFGRRFSRPVVDVLIHNAGVMLDRRTHTEDGLETTLATHLVGPLLLTGLLTKKLARSESPRVVFVSSGGMYTQKLDNRLLFDPDGKFDGMKVYAQTKRAQVILAEILADALGDRGIRVHSMHPGWVDTPGVRRSMPLFWRLTRTRLRSPEQGADTVLWLAAAAEAGRSSGLLWFDRRVQETHKLPGTRESDQDRLVLWSRCRDACGPECTEMI